MKIKNIFKKSFWTKKRIIGSIIILIIALIAGYFIFGREKINNKIQTFVVTRQNLQETVLATGQVVSKTDLNLSFQGSGVVRQVLVKAGDKVYAGQLLAAIDQSSAMASLTSAKGSLKQAEANYNKLVNGLTTQEIQVYEDAVSTAKVNLDNSYNGALGTLNSAYTVIYNTFTVVSSLQNNYFSSSDQQGIKVNENKNFISEKLADSKALIEKANSKNSIDKANFGLVANLNSVLNSLRIIRDMCDEGVYYSKISATDKASIDTQKTSVNTSISNINTLQNSIASYKIAIVTAENNLSLKQTKPRQEDIDFAEAQIISAKGQIASAEAVLNNLALYAPLPGTITTVDIKVGEQAVSLKEIMVLQNISDLHTEANISEANIANLKIGQQIEYSFDALGPDKIYYGKILAIDPASTVISGVVNYKVTGSLENISEIKPGMTTNMTILVNKKDNVLAVASSAVINKNNKQFIKIIDDPKTKTYHEVEVKTGMQADGGLIEILSGVSEGQEIVVYIKP